MSYDYMQCHRFRQSLQYGPSQYARFVPFRKMTSPAQMCFAYGMEMNNRRPQNHTLVPGSCQCFPNIRSVFQRTCQKWRVAKTKIPCRSGVSQIREQTCHGVVAMQPLNLQPSPQEWCLANLLDVSRIYPL